MIEERMSELRSEGCRPFNTSSDGYAYRGISYVDGFLEIWEQLQPTNTYPDAIYVCSGAHTHTGMVIASKALGVQLRFIGIIPSPRNDVDASHHMANLANKHAKILALETEFTPTDFESYSEFVGPDYGVITDKAAEAIRFFARSEGLFLDPSYTGKTVAGLMAHIERSQWSSNNSIVLVHKGGAPALFASATELDLSPSN